MCSLNGSLLQYRVCVISLLGFSSCFEFDDRVHAFGRLWCGSHRAFLLPWLSDCCGYVQGEASRPAFSQSFASLSVCLHRTATALVHTVYSRPSEVFVHIVEKCKHPCQKLEKWEDEPFTQCKSECWVPASLLNTYRLCRRGERCFFFFSFCIRFSLLFKPACFEIGCRPASASLLFLCRECLRRGKVLVKISFFFFLL